MPPWLSIGSKHWGDKLVYCCIAHCNIDSAELCSHVFKERFHLLFGCNIHLLYVNGCYCVYFWNCLPRFFELRHRSRAYGNALSIRLRENQSDALSDVSSISFHHTNQTSRYEPAGPLTLPIPRPPPVMTTTLPLWLSSGFLSGLTSS